MSNSSQYASSVGSARSDRDPNRADPMHEFMEIAKQTRLMALATQGELVTTHAHIKRFERQLEAERDARLRLERDVQGALADTKRTLHALREELATLASTIYQLAPRAPPLPSCVQLLMACTAVTCPQAGPAAAAVDARDGRGAVGPRCGCAAPQRSGPERAAR